MMEFLLGGELGPAGSLEWTASVWAIQLAVAAALLAWGASWLGERSLAARVGEAVLWGLALVGVVVALARPVWVEEEGREEPGRVVVLVDASRSMSILEDGVPRSRIAMELVGKLDKGDVDVYHFGDDLAVGRPEGSDLPGTDVEGALDALSERIAGEKLAGVVLISDGLDRGLLRKRFESEERPAVPSVPGPLTVFQVGTQGEIKDLAVRGVDAGGFAFARHNFRIRAEIEGLGFENQVIKATLLRDGAPVTQQPVALDGLGQGEVVFEVVTENAGRFNYEVQVPVFEGDVVPANNSLPVVVRSVVDKIRVLQVTGTPSWDVKFLRRFLKEDPSVDLVSFFILRTRRDLDAGFDDRELSLIQFPYDKLFTEDLWSFDVVIFQNFDWEPYFTRGGKGLLSNIREYVEQGGAFAMVGGDRSYDLGRYGETPIQDILPLKLGLPKETSVAEGAFRPLLTEQGARHPITRLVTDSEENGVWWDRLHTMDGANRVRGVHEDAAVLLTHPTETLDNGQPLPVLAVREAGKGRSMALTVDSSWRWSFSEAAQGRGNQAYLRFWKNAFRWLMADPSASRVTVDTPRENYAAGDSVRIVVRARTPGFAPLEGADVQAKVIGRGGAVLSGQTGPDGEAVLEYQAVARGAHRVEVTVTNTHGAASGQGEISFDLEEVGRAETVFAVTTRDPELDEVAPDAEFLQWLAGATKGRYYEPGDFGPVVRDATAGRTVWDRRETAVWRAPLLGLWIAFFAGLAWIVRRRAGLR